MKPRMNGSGERLPKNEMLKTAKRLLNYVVVPYKKQFLVVIVCILISALAGVASSLFLQVLIDDYIAPLIGMENPVFTGLLKAILLMALIYFIGTLATLFYTRIMVTIAQGVLKKIRDDMFIGMQKLPVKYFDTHTYGDIMSRYTNDTDSLRQMISQSIPQTFSSLITVISVFIAMLCTSIPLTVVVLVTVSIMLFIAKKVGGNSAKYFVEQQKDLGKVNGYIEEMMNGQKVVKVFCH